MFSKRKIYRSALVTGASHGIGRSIALNLASEVDNLALLAKDHEVSDVAEQCRSKGANAVCEIVNVTNASELRKIIGTIDEESPIDLVVCCAGISPVTASSARTERFKLISELMQVNFLGSVATVDAILPRMIKRGHGQIALMSSIAAFIPTGDSPSYCASKSAVLAYGRSMRHRIKNFGVDISVVCPGYVRTRLTDNLNSSQVGIISTEEAAVRTISGLRKNRGVIAFPFRTHLFARFMAAAPEFIGRRLVEKFQYK